MRRSRESTYGRRMDGDEADAHLRGARSSLLVMRYVLRVFVHVPQTLIMAPPSGPIGVL